MATGFLRALSLHLEKLFSRTENIARKLPDFLAFIPGSGGGPSAGLPGSKAGLSSLLTDQLQCQKTPFPSLGVWGKVRSEISQGAYGTAHWLHQVPVGSVLLILLLIVGQEGAPLTKQKRSRAQ